MNFVKLSHQIMLSLCSPRPWAWCGRRALRRLSTRMISAFPNWRSGSLSRRDATIRPVASFGKVFKTSCIFTPKLPSLTLLYLLPQCFSFLLATFQKTRVKSTRDRFNLFYFSRFFFPFQEQDCS